MKNLSILRSAARTGFSYTPPDRVYGAVRVLVIVGQTTSDVLANVLRGFWRFTPQTRVLVTEHEVLVPSMMNDNMRPVDLSLLPMRPYVNHQNNKQVIASTLLAEVDACITVSTFGAGVVSPSLAVMAALASNNVDLSDVYFSLGHLFAGSLVDIGEKVIWGDSVLDVDAAAYNALNQPLNPKLKQIRGD